MRHGPISIVRKRRQSFLHGRAAAEQTIQIALLTLRAAGPSEGQLEGRSDAIDALLDRTYVETVRLSENAIKLAPGCANDWSVRLSELDRRFEAALKRPYPIES